MFQRRPLPGQHSIERVFADVRDALPADITVRVEVLPWESRRVTKRLGNMWFAYRRRGDVNHITGDVHYIALALPKRRTILTIHDLVPARRLHGIRRSLVLLAWYRLPVRACDHITVISDWTRQELVGLLPRSAPKIVVIPNPVSPSFLPTAPPRSIRPVVLQVGTGPDKNVSRVIDALCGLEVHLRLIGRLTDEHHRHLARSGTDFSSAWDLAPEQMVQEYSNADIVVLASTYEGFGLPILEAQASGRPIITSSLASMPEVAGQGALFVDPADEVQIRGAVRSLTEDRALYDSLIDRGLANVRRFAARSVAGEYASLYRSALRT